MPDRNRRQSREPSTDREVTKNRSRRASDAAPASQERRKRRGHRATDSTGALLPAAASNQTGTRSGESSREAAPLSLDALAELDRINKKRDKKKGLNTYDEAYLAQVREREERLEEKRQKEERRRKREEKLRQAEEEAEAEAERERQQERRQRRERQRARRESERLTADEAHDRRKGVKESKTKSKQTAVPVDVRIPKTPERKRKADYQKLDEKTTPHSRQEKRDKKKRLISGPFLEDGRAEKVYRHEKHNEDSVGLQKEKAARKKKVKRWLCIGVIGILVILIIAIPVAVVVNRNKDGSSGGGSSNNLNGASRDSIPASARGGLLDPFTWADTADFNVTYTDETVGGLSVMGLQSNWDDSVQANPNVPALKDSFAYGSMPIRGMNVGGWLAIEPFITPSFFNRWNSRDGVIDEYTLTSKLGSTAAGTLEKHYSTFVNKQTFADIRAAGFDHVRIPFSYWAVTTYTGDPYVAKISWRYLLRGIEYCRQNGLRVNLDLHGAPGSQNGWNHSGRQGAINWLNGPDGDLNAQRTLDVHDQLSKFFAQPRYKNVITLYGLVNEPRMISLDTQKVIDWTDKAITIVRANKISAIIVFGDGFLGLDNWQGKLQSHSNLLLDVHQYVIFNNDQIVLKHTDKLNFACKGWTAQMTRSQNKQTGFGPTICGEWSQADTDCAPYLNNVGAGTRWEGTLGVSDPTKATLKPFCPAKSGCSCSDANASANRYSDAYKKWLLSFAQAQMDSFESGWGWFYWTWQTESAVQWSWKLGMQAGILPTTVQQRSFHCNDTIPDYGTLGLAETY